MEDSRLYKRWQPANGEESYWTCDCCGPINDDDYIIDSSMDMNGDHSCDICDMEFNHEAGGYERAGEPKTLAEEFPAGEFRTNW